MRTEGKLKLTRWLLLVGLVILLIGATAFWFLRPKQPRVTIATVQAQTIQNKIFAAGDVKPVQREVLQVTQLPGPIQKVFVAVGDTVKIGQVLATTNSSSEQASLDAAETAVNQAKAILLSTQQQAAAAPQGFQSQFSGTLAQERTSLAEANAQLEQAQAAYDATRIHATIAGIVLVVNPDGIAADGSQAPAFEVVGATKQIVVQVSEVDAVHLSKGLDATIDSDAYPNQKWQGKVTFVAPFASAAANGATQVEVHISLPKTCPIALGYQVNVHIVSQTHQHVPVVPYDALYQSGSNYVVFTLGADSRVEQTAVKLGITTDTSVEVTVGLKPGQRVVINPQPGLQSGQKVVVTGHA